MSCSVVYWSEATSEPPKVVRTPSVLNIFTSKCPSRHNGVHFFDIRTSKKWSEHGVFCTFWLGNVLRATTACTFSTSQLPKVVRSWCVLCISLGNVLRATTACTFSTSQLPKVVRQWCALYIFTSKCASRHNGVHFFDIWTSKSGPNPWCFVPFDLEMCFAPQRRPLFRHLNCQKWSGAGVFFTFWLGSVLRATTACNFSSLIWPHGSAPAALASLLFDPPEPQWHSESRLSYLFAHLQLLSSDSFSSLTSLLWLFPSLLFICPYCRKFDF